MNGRPRLPCYLLFAPSVHEIARTLREISCKLVPSAPIRPACRTVAPATQELAVLLVIPRMARWSSAQRGRQDGTILAARTQNWGLDPAVGVDASERQAREARAVKVLVVDNEEIMRVSVQNGLRDAGHQAVACSSAEEALGRLARESFDAAVVDVMMPGMGGLEFLGLVRRDHPEVDVIVMTAYGMDQGAAEAKERGARAYLDKPFDAGELLQLLELS